MDVAVQPGKCILVFIKTPEKRIVKSRLAATIGEEHTCRLYEFFVLDLLKTLEIAADDRNYALKVCFYPPESGKAIAVWLGNRYEYLPQQGGDLGERMSKAFRKSLAAGHRQILLVGSDIPDLPAQIIHGGFASLKKHGTVIGPAHDGGYYLIDFRSDCFLPDIFADIRWGTSEVFEKTMTLFRLVNQDLSILPAWRDIDTLEDLRDMQSRHPRGDFINSETLRYLLAQGMTIPGLTAS
jgi:rSAM/selenodomain-associated transferase 1